MKDFLRQAVLDSGYVSAMIGKLCDVFFLFRGGFLLQDRKNTYFLNTK